MQDLHVASYAFSISKNTEKNCLTQGERILDAVLQVQKVVKSGSVLWEATLRVQEEKSVFRIKKS
jgi:hypothetical protein